jgi:glycine C-acetyltransferase
MAAAIGWFWAAGIATVQCLITGFGYPAVPEGQHVCGFQMSAVIEEEHMEQALGAFEEVGRDLELI